MLETVLYFLVQKNNLVDEGDIGFVASLFLFAGVDWLHHFMFQTCTKNKPILK